MTIHPRSIRSFYAVHTEDSALRFQMPQGFMNQEDLPETVTIRTNGKEMSWDVAMEAGCCLTRGWSKLVNDVDLQLGDILVFWLLGSSTLEIVPFDGHDLCPKPLTFNTPSPCNNNDDDTPSPSSQGGSFVAVMTKNNRSKLYLPPRFWNGSGMEKKKWVSLVDPKGRKWYVKILPHSGNRVDRVYLGYGWGQFREDNALADGDECDFSLVRGEPDTIKVIARPTVIFVG